MYSHTVLVPKTLTFLPEYYNCPKCAERLEKHIICEGARFHVHSWFGTKHGGECRCSEPICEDNHKCQRKK